MTIKSVEELTQDLPRDRAYLIEYLHRVQDEYRFISRAHLKRITEILQLSLSEVFETATFYHNFHVIDSEDETQPPGKLIVQVCESLACELSGAVPLLNSLKQKLGDQVRLVPAPCVGRCQHAPVAIVGQNAIDNASAAEVVQAVEQSDTKCHQVEYLDYDAYLAQGGYQILLACRKDKTPAQIIELIKQANLQGLGGAGFPSYIKWQSVLQYPKPRLAMINIDEGEMGTFKDRYYLETNPHQCLEGALIATWAIEADALYLYLRNEYATAREILQKEIAKLEQNPPCPLPKIYLRRGAGSYICGEESAMIESMEGKRGFPRLKPPRMQERGLFNLPTLGHNLETLYWVVDIIKKGPEWYQSLGKEGHAGLRSFSISGRVKNPGVYIAPAGVTMNELINDYCGGMVDDAPLKAYVVGGSSGGVLPASKADIPLDFRTLEPYDCFIGSMAIVVLNARDSVKQSVLNTTAFLRDESCGQCTPCRSGTEKIIQLLSEPKLDLELSEDVCQVMADASICGLGQSAPIPVRCLIKYFPEEISL